MLPIEKITSVASVIKVVPVEAIGKKPLQSSLTVKNLRKIYLNQEVGEWELVVLGKYSLTKITE